MINLAELLAQDLTQLDDETLVAGLHDAEHAADLAADASTQIARVLKGRYSWAKLVELTGLPQTTLHNRAYPRPRRKGTERE